MKKILSLMVLVSAMILGDGTIFVLHRFDDERYPSTNIKTEELRRYFDYLKENSYEVVPLEKMVEELKNERDIPESWVAFTIDDGYKSFYENGLEVFKEYEYPFTVFVNTIATNKRYPDYMTWDQLKETEKYGSIGNHSHKHLKLVKTEDDEIVEDTKLARELLEKNLENPLNYYAYPYGEYDERVREAIKKSGVEVIFNQSTGAISKNSNIYDINRIALGNDENIKSKLKIKFLDIDWEEVKVEDNKVISIEATIPKEIKKVEVYMSGYGWEYVKVADGKIKYDIDKELKLGRSRIIIKDFSNNWASYLIMKK